MAEDVDVKRLGMYIEELTCRPFDLSGEPMLRATLMRLTEEEHILVLVLHHIASDGWSLSVIVRELVELYGSYTEGRPAILSPVPVQYADYALWQRKYLSGDVLERKMAYWKEELREVATLELPTDRPRPLVQSTRGAVLGFTIDKELSDQVQQLSRQQGATLFMTLLAGFQVLLHRYSGQKDICVGSAIAGRQQQEVEGLIGFFVNTLALRSRVEGRMTFVELLQQVKQTTLEAYEHQEAPFEKVVEAVVKVRDRSRTPLFQVMFALQNTPEVPTLHLGELVISQERPVRDTTQFDLNIAIRETPAGLKVVAEYCTDLYEEETIGRLMGHYEQLLRSVAARPDQRIGELEMLSSAERQLLKEFNATTMDYPRDKTIVDLFEEQILRTPEATAVVFGEERLTYRELDERSNQLGHYLCGRGVGPEMPVPVCMERSPELIIGMLGILKAGGAYVPIDPSYPAERIGYMLEDTEATLVLSNIARGGRLPETNVIALDDWSEIGREPVERLAVRRTADQLAYVIYTSGSTGRPKGVMIEQRGLVNLVNWHRQEYEVTEASRSTALAGVGFDAFGWEIWPYLSAGSCIYLIPDAVRLSAMELSELYAGKGITHSFIPTAMVADCIAAFSDRVSSLQYMLTGGDRLGAVDTSGLGYTVVNNYGPTENTVVATRYRIVGQDKGKTPPIGRPIANTRIYIVSEEGQLCPVGVEGEMCIAGGQVAQGYWKQPELTAEKFISDPFDAAGDGRMYRTGDIARWLGDGNIEYLGRMDDQVKIRGYRIELGEIESVLVASGLVRQAVVVVQEGVAQEKRLVGYVVMPEENRFDREELLHYMREQPLPEYMIPSAWVALTELPLTPNRKIDRKALPDPENKAVSGEQYVPPATATEKTLVRIWEELLEVERVGVEDNFFALGGHSLLAIRLVSSMRKELSMEVPLGEVFEHATIRSMLEQARSGPVRALLPALEVQERPEGIPLSFSQERLWFIDQLEGSVQYHVPVVLRMRGRLDECGLAYALGGIVDRHEVLRTVIRQQNGETYQEMLEKGSWKLSIVEDVGIERLGIYIEELTCRPFDLSGEPMLRATLMRLTEEEHILVLVLHHIAADGWSWSVIVRELVELYGSHVERRPAILPPLPVQYADYALWQRKYLSEAVLERKLDYWKEKLREVAPLELPTDHPRPLIQSTRGAVLGFTIDKELSDRVQQLSRQQGTTLFMTLLAGFQVLLHRYTGQRDICVGSPIAGRQQQEVEGLIGFL